MDYHKIRDQQKLYFVTFTVIHWIDVFVRNIYRDVFVDSVKYCQKEKGLEVYAWCIMTSHVHMILGTEGDNPLEWIIRDLKSFTSRSIRKLLEDREMVGESRRECLSAAQAGMYGMMRHAGMKNSNNHDFQFWQQDSHPMELNTNKIMNQKLEYLPRRQGGHSYESSGSGFCRSSGSMAVQQRSRLYAWTKRNDRLKMDRMTENSSGRLMMLAQARRLRQWG